MNGKIFWAIAAAAVTFVGFSVAPGTAEACGGFFCNGGGGTGPQPVVQAAERVIFEKDADGTIRAYVQIRYDGNAPVGFSWVIPVLGLPEVGIAEASTFDALDGATNPQFRFINRAAVSRGSSGGGGGIGCGSADFASAARGAEDGAIDVEGVTVWDSARVGDYETATLSGDSAADVINWLAANEYDIPAEAEPMIGQYVTEGHLFVAFKYDPIGVGTGTLDPVVLTYRGEKPCVPLRITAIASTPILDIMVMAFGEQRAMPEGGYALTEPDYDAIRTDPTAAGQTTYGVEVARAISEAGGRAFVTEYAAPTDTIADAIVDVEAQAILARNAYVTRFYTRMDPADMTIDPEFIFPGGADVARFHVIDITRACCSERASPSSFAAAVATGADRRKERTPHLVDGRPHLPGDIDEHLRIEATPRRPLNRLEVGTGERLCRLARFAGLFPDGAPGPDCQAHRVVLGPGKAEGPLHSQGRPQPTMVGHLPRRPGRQRACALAGGIEAREAAFDELEGESVELTKGAWKTSREVGHGLRNVSRLRLLAQTQELSILVAQRREAPGHPGPW
ncbi:MAG: DUF2330 domain-containing protein [Deltaproteobacteria bacterium]|nr:DUF2330 domain-containing protein [Deltaproteobacteria bacterium]